MRRSTRTFVAIAAAGCLLGLPAAAASGKGEAERCAKTPLVSYSVHGTLVSVTPDDPQTSAFEGTVTLTVKGANSHARKSGEIADQDAAKKAVQVKGATYTVPSSDAFTLKLDGFKGADTPSPGDKVHVKGKIALTKKKCAPAGTTLADRYLTPDVRRVTISDRDPDA